VCLPNALVRIEIERKDRRALAAHPEIWDALPRRATEFSLGAA
jgi:hypothetical protein